MDALCCEAGPRFCKGDSEALARIYGRSCGTSMEKRPKGAFVQALDTEVKAIKQHKETRREYMTLAMELKRMFAEGERTGEQKKETMMILEMLREGISKETIARCARVSVEYVVELGKRNHLL